MFPDEFVDESMIEVFVCCLSRFAKKFSVLFPNSKCCCQSLRRISSVFYLVYCLVHVWFLEDPSLLSWWVYERLEGLISSPLFEDCVLYQFFFCKNCMILFYLSWRPLLFPMLLFQKCYWFQWRMPILVWNSPEIPCLWVMSWSAICGGGWGWCSAKKVILMGAWSEMIMLWMVGSFILYVIELLTIK